MNAKDILTKVKALFNDAPVAPVVTTTPTALAAKTYKLQDGTEVSISQAGDAPAVGDVVTVNGAPAPAGEWTLEDGSKLTTDATGVITVVGTGTAPVTQDLSNVPAPLNVEQRVAAIEAELAKLKQPQMMAEQFAKVEDSLKTRIDKQDEIIKGLFELCEELVKVPGDNPKTLTTPEKEKFSKQKEKEDRLQNYAAGLKKLKEQKQ